MVWWKTSLSLSDLPRRHTIGWCDASGAPYGTITIASNHPRLDRRTIETALHAHLRSPMFAIPPRLAPAADIPDADLTAEARLRAAGHQVLVRDLASVYGDDALGGVVATLLGRGIDAYILIDHDARHAARTAICQAAEHALGNFQNATPEQLHAAGWERGLEDRWQLLLQRAS